MSMKKKSTEVKKISTKARKKKKIKINKQKNF